MTNDIEAWYWVLDNEAVDIIKGTLDGLGKMLAGHDHQWLPLERAAYEYSMELLGRKEDVMAKCGSFGKAPGNKKGKSAEPGKGKPPKKTKAKKK